MEAIKYNSLVSFNETMRDHVLDSAIVSITDYLGRIEYANDNFCKILECDASRLVGETHELLKSPLYTGKVYKNLWRTIRMGNKWNGILSDFSSTGIEFWLDTTIIPIRNEGENTLKYLSIYKDVTKYYKNNNQLLKTALVNEKFLERMPLQVFTISKHGKILNANKSFCNKGIGELIGTYIYDYFIPTTFESFKENIDKVYVDKLTHQFELHDFDAVGRKMYYSVVVSPNPRKMGEPVSATIALYEITKFKGVSDVLRDSEAKFRSIYRSINVGIIVVADEKGNITAWNKGAEEAFGYTEKETIGRSLTVLMSKKYKKGNISELLRAVSKIKKEENVDIIEMCCLRKNGEVFPVEFALSSGSVDNHNYYCAMMFDITERKALQNRLEQKTKDLELFLYRSAHDLKAPFSSAEGLVNLLKEEINSDKVASLTGMLDTVIKNGKELSENLSQASNISINKSEFKKIDFSSAIDNILISLRDENKLDNIKLNVNVVDTFGFRSNQEMINYILQNLIINAIKYSVKPDVNCRPYVNIAVKTSQEKVVLTIEDNGVGICKKKINKIFDLYYRANKYDVPGHGLGLYIVRNIVDNLHGEITVESYINSGSIFKIVLPNNV
ncbi:PAS domain-containing protein [Lacinutrix mariniflava]|uniref:PAS domain-containing protein n=1 Tax=Lacinutrix mariniflava TaxID=342955 RepID=UPI0006E411B2|nr:PAS domain S-box protein [Lacinutrix mariniflava]